MYENNRLHLWGGEGMGHVGEAAPTAHFADLIDNADPAFTQIMQAILRFTKAGVELTEEMVTAAVKLGQFEHRRWTMADGNSFRADRVPADSRHNPVVYYVRRGALIKIGTTTDLRRRMREILPEELLALEPGSIGIENDRHRQFSALRVPGQREWFHAGPVLQEHVLDMRATHGVPDQPLPTLPV
ncbi:GIY-YIG nuclease family protein [Streptomyces rubiginosohelvolus]|uniref:GIY-YIG nuclease family protein n=1 Tax=Streptomyces rubiginosohelvolus TaxID=67362 RepID=UPI00380A810F